jgi:hypothetical protein
VEGRRARSARARWWSTRHAEPRDKTAARARAQTRRGRECGRSASVARRGRERTREGARARVSINDEPNGSSRSRRRNFGRANAHADAAVRRSPTRRVRRAARRSATRRRAPREVAADAGEKAADHRKGNRRPPEPKDVFREGAAGGFEPAPLIEDACLEPLHHPGKLALLYPGRGILIETYE